MKFITIYILVNCSLIQKTFGDNFTFASNIKKCVFLDKNSTDSVKLVCDVGVYVSDLYPKDECYTRLFEDESRSFRRSTVKSLSTGNCRTNELDSHLTELFPNLISLDISYLGLKQPLRNHAIKLPDLKKLNASRNELTKIEDDSFFHINSITDIDFSNNKIVDVPSTTFEDAPSLESINLSYNKIRYLHSSTFDNLRNLQFIDLSANDLYAFDLNIFKNNLNLQEIHIRGNSIRRFFYDINIIPEFKSLIVFQAGLNDIHVCYEEIIKKFGPALQVLDLSFHDLLSLSDNTFEGLRGLQHVNLRCAALEAFNFDIFENPNELKYLDLSRNRLNNVKYTSKFGNFGNLKSIYLQNNNLKRFDGLSIDNFPRLSFIGISQNRFSCEYATELVRQFNSSITDAPCDQKKTIGNDYETTYEMVVIIIISSISVFAMIFATTVICFVRREGKLKMNQNVATQLGSSSNNQKDEPIYEDPIYCEIVSTHYVDTYDHLTFVGLQQSTIKNHYHNANKLKPKL